jgi:MATE family multidrug resistance protein
LIDWAVVAELNRLGWPISITFAVEVLLFVGGALVIGTMGTTPLAAHQVTINIAAVAFMVPLGLGQAANVRVGYHLGAGLPAAARRAGLAALGLGAIFNLATATLMLAAPRGLAALYQLDPARPADAEVIALVVHLLAIGAFFQLFDGAQAVAAGILRGYKDTRVPMVLAGLSYWGIGAPAAWILGVGLSWGAAGVWWGLALGLAAAAVLLCGRFLRVSGALARG